MILHDQDVAKLGVLEIFFGPQWEDKARLGLAQFLGRHGFDFSVYAPKADSNLRKNWRQPWPTSYLDRIGDMRAQHHEQGVRFGVALSPFGLGDHFSNEDRQELKAKIRLMNQVQLDIIALFFDDMPVHAGLARSQIQAIEIVKGETDAQIVFCPTFYSFDPILEKVFGEKPANYLEELASQLTQDIDFVWTGPKVISKEISDEHLSEVSQLLRRGPFLCDNFFANDGPKNCKFLKITPPTGRTPQAFSSSRYWGINPMNQIYLSQIVMLAFKQVAVDGQAPQAALDSAIKKMCSNQLAELIQEQRINFLEKGLDQLTEVERNSLNDRLKPMDEPAANEIRSWLAGEFNVGQECLTD